MTHTPGPWHARGQRVEGPLSSGLAFCGESTVVGVNGTYSIGRREAEANARLIAAAPDLLAALERLVATLERQVASPHLAERASPLAQAKEAINKATGGKA